MDASARPARRRRVALVGGATFVVLCVMLFVVVPWALRGPVAERVRAVVDRSIDADVTWDAVEISLLRSFPNLSLGLRELTVVGVERFEGDTLAAVGRFSVVVDLGSAFRVVRGGGPLVVRSVRVDRPALRLGVEGDGARSWDILTSSDALPDDEPGAPPPATDEDRGGLAVELRALTVSDERMVFENEGAGFFAEVEGLSHTLAGNFSSDRLTATTRTRADRTTLVFAGTPYLAGVAVDFRAELALDLVERHARFVDNELLLNDLAVRFAGEATAGDEELALDLTFEAPTAEFRQILSLVPPVYASDFASLETAGRFELDGRVSGTYGPEDFPALSVRARIEDGSFRYPDLPLPAEAIAADFSIENPGGDPDLTEIRLSRFHIEIGAQPIDASATLRTPVSDPDVEARVEGLLDLGALGRTVKLEGAGDLAGTLSADASVRARRSDLDAERWDRIAARGTVRARGVTVRPTGSDRTLNVDALALSLAPERAALDTLSASIGASDLSANGSVENLLGFLFRDEPLTALGTFHSDRFVLDEWRSDDEELEVIPVPPALDLTLDGTIDLLTYGELVMENASGRLRVRDERLTLEEFGFSTLGGRIAMTGHYETTDPASPGFDLALDIDSLDVAGAAGAFETVRALAPVTRYARGSFSAERDLAGSLTERMAPVLQGLDGAGTLLTSRIAIEGFPALERLAGLVPVPALAAPTFEEIRSSVRIEEGRLHVAPFEVPVAGTALRVEGSNGIDQTLDYRLGLDLPRSSLGDAADRFVQDLAGRIGQPGIAFSPGQMLSFGVRVGGTVSDPVVSLGPPAPGSSARETAGAAAGAAVDRQVEEARDLVDSVGDQARLRAEARADSLIADAERRAEVIRAEAKRLADQVREEGARRADEVLAQAGNPIARRAAEPVANRIRNEANERADQIEREADERAQALLREAREQAAEIRGEG